jgi:outer membrane lipoprotein-sorting protein
MKRLIIALAMAASLVLAACAQKPTPDTVVEKMVKTLGGAEKLASVQDQISTWNSPMTMPMGDSTMTMNATLTITYKRPNKIKFAVADPNGHVGFISVFDGTNGWVYGVDPASGMGGVRDMTPAEIQENTTLAETWIDGWHNYAAKGIKLAMLSDTTLDGKTYHRIQATDKFGSVSMNYCDTQTGLMARSDAEMTDPATMQKAPSVMAFTDYAAHDGYMLAGKYTQHDAQGNTMMVATVKEVKHNTGVSDDAFAKPMPPPPASDGNPVPNN